MQGALRAIFSLEHQASGVTISLEPLTDEWAAAGFRDTLLRYQTKKYKGDFT